MKTEKSTFNEDKVNSAFATNLRKLFADSGKTHGNLADYLKQRTGDSVTRQAIGQWCNGNTSPNLKTVPIIADFFNVTTDYLLGCTDVKTIDINERAACELTGLSADALKKLIVVSKLFEGENDNLDGVTLNRVLNEFIGSSCLEKIICDISSYFRDYYNKSKEIAQIQTDKKELVRAFAESKQITVQDIPNVKSELYDLTRGLTEKENELEEEIKFSKWKAAQGYNDVLEQMTSALYSSISKKETRFKNYYSYSLHPDNDVIDSTETLLLYEAIKNTNKGGD